VRRSQPLRRTGGPKPKRKPTTQIGKVRTTTQLEVTNRHLFHDAARYQRVCQAPGCRRRGPRKGIDFQAHHVVYEQHLRNLRLPRYDARNALRLCPDCHKKHHGPNWKLPTSALLDENIAYGFLVLGAAAFGYFRRYYDDSAEDPRLVAAFEEAA
jgi:hypothetical protein